MTGPSFVPFESMSDAEQREHLRRVREELNQSTTRHERVGVGIRWLSFAVPPHTHDKPARRPEESCE